MSGTNGPTDLVEVFVERRSTSDEIKVADVKVLEFLYQNPTDRPQYTLEQLNYNKFIKMAARGVISTEDLPPSVSAAEQHALRA